MCTSFFLDLSLHLKKRNIFMKLNFGCRRLLKTHEVKDFSYLQWPHDFKFWNFCSTCVTTLHSCYNFAFVLHENALVFNQSEVHSFSCTLLHNNICDNKEHYNLIQFTEYWQSFILGSIFLSCMYWVVA